MDGWNCKIIWALQLYMLLFCRIPLVKDGLVSTKQITDAEAAKQKCLKGIKILDVGCGGGILCEVSETVFNNIAFSVADI